MSSPEEITEKGADRAAVKALPPLVYLFSVLAGMGSSRLFGGAIAPGSDVRLALGWVLIGAGFIMGFMFIQSFRKTDQDPDPRTPTPTLVITGLYQFSRNPAYLGLTVIQLGLGLVLDNIWIILFLAPALTVIHFGVIVPEEAYLERKFGDAYRDYRRQVRRWL